LTNEIKVQYPKFSNINEYRARWNDFYFLYVDGSKTAESVASAIWDEKKSMPYSTSYTQTSALSTVRRTPFGRV